MTSRCFKRKSKPTIWKNLLVIKISHIIGDFNLIDSLKIKFFIGFTAQYFVTFFIEHPVHIFNVHSIYIYICLYFFCEANDSYYQLSYPNSRDAIASKKKTSSNTRPATKSKSPFKYVIPTIFHLFGIYKDHWWLPEPHSTIHNH